MTYIHRIRFCSFLYILFFLSIFVLGSVSLPVAADDLPSDIISQTSWRETANNQAGYTIRLPEHYSLVPNTPPFTFAYGPREGGYPVVTVVQQEGQKTIAAEDLSALDGETVRSYRLVGLTDIKLLKSSLVEYGNIPVYRAELEFGQNPALFSSLSVFPSQQRYFSVTTIGLSSEAASIRTFAQQVEKYFSILSLPSSDEPPLSAPAPNSWKTHSFYWILGLFFLLIAIQMGFQYRKIQKIKKMQNDVKAGTRE